MKSWLRAWTKRVSRAHAEPVGTTGGTTEPTQWPQLVIWYDRIQLPETIRRWQHACRFAAHRNLGAEAYHHLAQQPDPEFVEYLRWAAMSLYLDGQGDVLNEIAEEAQLWLSESAQNPDIKAYAQFMGQMWPSMNGRQRITLEQAKEHSPSWMADDWTLLLMARAEKASGRVETLNELFASKGLVPIGLAAEKPTHSSAFDRLTALPLGNTADADAASECVSILLPVYNAEKTLETSVRSLLQQTWTNIEIIAVDDCSTDGSLRLLKDMSAQDSRLRVIQSESNRGAYPARNTALAAARGSFITVADSDDWHHPEKIERQIRHLLEEDRYIANMTACFRADEHLKPTPRNRPFYKHINPSSLMFRKDKVLPALGAWNAVRFGADTEFYNRLNMVFGTDSIMVLDLPLFIARVREGSLTSNPDHGYFGYDVGARKEYVENYRFFQGQCKLEELRYDIDDCRSLPFPVPDSARSERLSTGEYDTVLAGDFRQQELENQLIRALRYWRGKGANAGILHIQNFDPSQPDIISPTLRETLFNSNQALITMGDRISTTTLILDDSCSILDVTAQFRNLKYKKLESLQQTPEPKYARNKSIIPFERLNNVRENSQEIANAEHIISIGWVWKSNRALRLDQPIPWALTNQDERSWNFLIHSLDMIDPLLRAHSQGGEISFLEAAKTVALDWIKQHANRSNSDLSPLAWYDMSVGMRVYRLVYLLDAGRAAGLLNRSDQQLLWTSLEEHASYLSEDVNIAFHNNHGYYQIAGQLAMGRRFMKESSSMALAFEQGALRLKSILNQQFASDGVHREHSPDYHRMVYSTLKALMESGLVHDPEIVARAKCIERALAWFILPNQCIATFGDSNYRLMNLSPADSKRKWTTPEMHFITTDGKTGRRFESTWISFDEGGYFVVRMPSATSPGDPRQDSYFAQSAAFHSRTHKHADHLTFLWHDRGSDLIVDAGRYGYIGKTEQGSDLWLDGHWYSDPMRIYCESTRAHNTLEFDGRNFPRRNATPFGSALRRSGETKSGVIYVESECKHFESIQHIRLMVFLPGKWLLALDWFDDSRGQTHTVRQWLHLAPHLEPQLEGGRYLVPVPGSTQAMHIASLLPTPQPSRLHRGETEPVIQGWWSDKERNAIPNCSINYGLSNLTTGSFGTILSFADFIETKHEESSMDSSGRKAKLKWRDESAMHQITIERPSEGDLVLDYIRSQ